MLSGREGRARFTSVGLAVLVLVFGVSGVKAGTLDSLTVTVKGTGWSKQQLLVTAGPSGAPYGFTVFWTTTAAFEAQGGHWLPPGTPGQNQISYTGTPTLNRFPGESSTFRLGPGASITVEIGDVLDETGAALAGEAELTPSTDYVYGAFANAGGGIPESGISTTEQVTTLPPMDCTYTIGFWRTHPDAWPVYTFTLGTVSYDEAQLFSILNQPVEGNGLVSLSHQLIGVKLNIANGADPTVVSTAVSSADDLIGSLVAPPIGSGYLPPAATSALTQRMDDYNSGVIGPGHCGSTPTGACCLADGSCVEVTAADCSARGGVYHGDGVDCASVSCPSPPPPSGACCLEGGACQPLTNAACIEAGGTFMGAGVACEPGMCPITAVEPSSWGRVKSLYR